MGYSYTFTFRLTANERQWLAALAQRLYRTESSTVRWLIYEAARERGLVPQPAEAGKQVAMRIPAADLTECRPHDADRSKER